MVRSAVAMDNGSFTMSKNETDVKGGCWEAITSGRKSLDRVVYGGSTSPPPSSPLPPQDLTPPPCTEIVHFGGLLTTSHPKTVWADK